MINVLQQLQAEPPPAYFPAPPAPTCRVAEFPTPEERDSAIRKLDGLSRGGRKIRCERQVRTVQHTSPRPSGAMLGPAWCLD